MMTLALRSPNRLLASLPEADFALLAPHLESVELIPKTVLVHAGEPITHAYFPHNVVISLVIGLANGDLVEVSMIGRNGVFGGSAALGDRTLLCEAVIQIPGTATALNIDEFRKAAEKSSTIRTMLFRHEQALLSQAQQAAACNATHSVESRMARWLLLMHDLSDHLDVELTQEFLAHMLGVQRNRVSFVAHTLQQAGIIHYNRGHIAIADLSRLKTVTCECYRIVKAQYCRLWNTDSTDAGSDHALTE